MRSHFSLIALLCLGSAAGCQQVASGDVSGSYTEGRAAQADASTTPAVDGGSISSKSVTLNHDFGVVRSGTKVTHRYAVVNDSQFPWTLKRIDNTCSCTVVNSSGSTIPPGTSGEFDLLYAASGSARDDSRASTLVFEESQAPFVTLMVHAQVREPMTCIPGELIVHCAPQTVRESVFEVYNYSDVDWTGIMLTPSAPWLTADASQLRVETKRGEGQPHFRQGWRIAVAVNSDVIPVGSHSETIAVSSRGHDVAIRKVVPVQVRIRTPIAAIPGQLFFGAIPTNGTASRNVIVQFNGVAAPSSPDSVSLHHDLGTALTFHWTTTDANHWRLTATLDANDGVGFIRGNVTVRFPESGLPDLSIPVHAVIEGN
jgi:hypothetical protein